MSPGVFDRLHIGPVELPNRLALAPVKTALGGTDGLATDRHPGQLRRDHGSPRRDWSRGVILVG